MANEKIIGTAVGLVLFVYVIAATVPAALTTITSVNSTGYSNWGSSILSLWGILGIFIVISIVLMIYSTVKKEM